jgi:protein-L-isoaspartate(D-aspartate) O-methyltransferase
MNKNARTNMIKQQLRTGDVLDETLLSLFEQYPRDYFVPQKFKEFAYSDMQIPLAHNQCMMTPLEEGKLLQSLELTGNEYVLEVGTGTGFLTTLLANLANKVTTIDYYEDFCSQAAAKFEKLRLDNIEVINGDACRGWMEKAPFDVIVLTGSISEVAPCFKPQLMKGGKLFTIVGQAPAMHGMLLKLDNNEHWHNKIIFETYIAPLIDKTKHQSFIF